MKGKLKCRPGYVQRGAACQPEGNKTPGQPKSKAGRRKKGGFVAGIVGAAVVGAGAAAMAAKGRNPQIKERQPLAKPKLEKPRELPKAVTQVVDKTIDKKAAASKKSVPPIVKKVAKQVAIDIAARVPARLAGAGFNAVASTGSDISTQTLGSLGVQAVVGYKSRKLLEKKYGAGLESRAGRVAVTMAVNLAGAGIEAAVAHAAFKGMTKTANNTSTQPKSEGRYKKYPNGFEEWTGTSKPPRATSTSRSQTERNI